MDDILGRHDDHEAKMARADLYKLANYSMKLFKMINEGDELEGWVQAKITKAADYIASVYHFMEYEMKSSEYGDALENAEMYSESIRRAFEQKLTEAKACKAKMAKAAAKDVDEGIEDKLAAAREKAAAKGKTKEKEEAPKSNTRKVAGNAYGGSKQKAEKEVDESAKPDYIDVDKDGDKKEPMKKAVKDSKIKKEDINKSDVPAYKRKASGAKDWKVSQADLDKEANDPKNISSKAGLAKLKKDRLGENSKKKVSEENLVEFAMDVIKHPKYGKIEWLNHGGAHMIATKDPITGSLKIHAMGTPEQIAAKWKKLKASIAGQKDSVVESFLSKVVTK